MPAKQFNEISVLFYSSAIEQAETDLFLFYIFIDSFFLKTEASLTTAEKLRLSMILQDKLAFKFGNTQ